MSLRTYAIWQKSRWIFTVVFILGLIPPALSIVRILSHSHVTLSCSLWSSTALAHRLIYSELHLFHPISSAAAIQGPRSPVATTRIRVLEVNSAPPHVQPRSHTIISFHLHTSPHHCVRCTRPDTDVGQDCGDQEFLPPAQY